MRPIDADALAKHVRIHCGDCGEAVECIMEAPTITPPPNAPLTLDELREMDGEPVWWEDKYERAGYGIVSISEFDKVIYIVAANRTFVAAAHGEMNRHLGLTLYRRKLEEERRDKQRAIAWSFGFSEYDDQEIARIVSDMLDAAGVAYLLQADRDRLGKWLGLECDPETNNWGVLEDDEE